MPLIGKQSMQKSTVYFKRESARERALKIVTRTGKYRKRPFLADFFFFLNYSLPGIKDWAYSKI